MMVGIGIAVVILVLVAYRKGRLTHSRNIASQNLSILNGVIDEAIPLQGEAEATEYKRSFITVK